MTRTPILLSGLGGSLFPYLHEKLIEHFDPVYVDADDTLKALYPKLDFHPAPLVLAPEYPAFINRLITQKGIKWYVPLIDEEILVAKNAVANTDCRLVSPDADFTQLCLNKLDLMEKLAETSISTIPSWRGDRLPDPITYPLFVKPIFGRGSRGIFKLEQRTQLQAYLALYDYQPQELIIQEYIAGQEYTVGVLANRNNDLISISSRKVLSKKGVTIRAVTEDNSVIEQSVQSIQRILQPCGPYNVQLYLTADNEVKIFEINPRFSTTVVMSYAGGVDELKLFTDYPDGYSGPVKRPQAGLELRRSWQNNFM